MANSDPFDLQQLGELVQTAVKAVAELHEVLDVVYGGKIHVDQIEKLRLRIGQILTRQELQQVPEIVTAMESNPMNVVIQNDPGGHEKFPETAGVDAVLVVLLEIDAALAQKLDGIVGEDVLVDVELPEIELPDAARVGIVVDVGGTRGKVAVLVRECEPQLDELEHVDVVL